jgi:uncharacterized membrane protein
MRQRFFWSGFSAGAGAIAGLWGVLHYARRGGLSRIVRLEKSVQIGAPLQDVFDAWANFREIPQHVPSVQDVRVFGTRTHWRVLVGNRPVEWDAEITQLIRRESIGWKSLSGPKHSGRITFSRLGNDTLVHVHMNYAPSRRLLRPMVASFAGDMEGLIERALREFKSSMEAGSATLRRSQNQATPTGNARRDESLASITGAYAPGPELVTDNENSRYMGRLSPRESIRPRKGKF